MKARTAAGLLASILVFCAAASADAAPGRRAKHRVPAAAAVSSDGAATKPAVARGSERTTKPAVATSTGGATRPAVAAGADRAAKPAAHGTGKAGAHKKKAAHAKKGTHAKKGAHAKKGSHPAKGTALTSSAPRGGAKATTFSSAVTSSEAGTESATMTASLVLPATEPSGAAAGSTTAPVRTLPSTTPANGAAGPALPSTAAAAPAAGASDSGARNETGAPEPRSTAAPGRSRFLASGVPLAEVRDGRFKGVGTAARPCGTKARWAKVKSRWLALDAWGQVTGTLTVAGSERYAGTGCHQVWFSEGTGQDGRGVFVAEGSGYAARTSAEWKADETSRKRFDRLYSSEETAWNEGKIDRGTAGRRTLFFSLPAQASSVEGAPTQRRPVHWAVSGGRMLIVAFVGSTGAWKVAHVLPPNGKSNAYEPLAVLDMNGDGLPEIVVHEEAGGVFDDRVLSFDPASMRWETAIESPGGASR